MIKNVFLDSNHCLQTETTENENSYLLKKVKPEPKNCPVFTSDKSGTLSSGDTIVNATKMFDKFYFVPDLFNICQYKIILFFLVFLSCNNNLTKSLY